MGNLNVPLWQDPSDSLANKTASEQFNIAHEVEEDLSILHKLVSDVTFVAFAQHPKAG